MSRLEPAISQTASIATTHRLRVCIVALHALPAIDPGLNRPVGGTETRAWTFARGLVQTGQCDVSFFVRADRPRRGFLAAGVSVVPRVDRLYGLYESVGRCVERSPDFPKVRLRNWEWPLLWRVPLLAACRMVGAGTGSPWTPERCFMNHEADIFCTFGVQANSARVIASAQATGRPAVLMIGSDGDLDARYQAGSDYVSPYGDVAGVCHQILHRADEIVVQTPEQQRLLADRFGRTGPIIANPIDLAEWDRGRNAPVPEEITGGLNRYALWIGRAESLHKRPETLLEIARLCPAVDFLMIMNPRDRTVEKRVYDLRPPNVRIVPQVPFDLIPAVFNRSAVFVSTSALEGFPNVFLQAAASGVPIASLHVGDRFLQAAGCGECSQGDVPRLAAYIRSLWDRSPDLDHSATDARAYVAAEHGLSVQSVRLLEVLKSVVARREGS